MADHGAYDRDCEYDHLPWCGDKMADHGAYDRDDEYDHLPWCGDKMADHCVYDRDGEYDRFPSCRDIKIFDDGAGCLEGSSDCGVQRVVIILSCCVRSLHYFSDRWHGYTCKRGTTECCSNKRHPVVVGEDDVLIFETVRKKLCPHKHEWHRNDIS